MLSAPQSELIWVDKPQKLRKAAASLLRYPRLAVDTESNSLYAYREQVCLIQFSTGESDYLIDPLALDDLSPLGEVFASPHIEKIFHAAEYDLICLKRDFGFGFANLFDTMLAGRILGRSETGLAAMLENEFGILLDKKFQRANWGKRPLPPDLLDYARLDTYYLLPLRERLAEELKQQGRWELAREDFHRLCFTAVPPANGHPNCWRIPGSRDLSPQQAAVLHELCYYRDQKARQMNLPVFKVLGNDILLKLALEQPQNLEALAASGVLSARQIQRHGEGLLQAIQHGRRASPIYPPNGTPRPADDMLQRLEALREWRKQAGRSLEVPSDVILPRDVLEEIAQACPRTLDELASVMHDLPWRFQQFGEQILAVTSCFPHSAAHSGKSKTLSERS
ncbi:MAG: HRDC domain-containing protein [Anaerolineales bacterium]